MSQRKINAVKGTAVKHTSHVPAKEKSCLYHTENKKEVRELQVCLEF